MTEVGLSRFVDAQAPVYSQVIQELASGRKRSHWMWFIFPQLAGLGQSPMAKWYAIRDLEEAKRFLADPILGDRLRQSIRLMLSQKRKIGVGDTGTSGRSKVLLLPDVVSPSSRRRSGSCASHGCLGSILWWQARPPNPCFVEPGQGHLIRKCDFLIGSSRFAGFATC